MNEKTTTSEYLLLFRNTGWHADLSAEEIQQNMARFTEWFERVNQAGQFKGGGPLGHYGKILAGKHAATDGPFVESKEYIGGVTIIRAPDLDDALQWSRRYAKATTLPIEVRPFQDESQR